MVTLSGFADEISNDLHEQLQVLKTEEIQHIDFRGVFGKNVLELSDAEIEMMKKELEKQNVNIACLASPIGKISILDSLDDHLEKLKRAFHIADCLQVKRIRIFSFFIPVNKNPDDYTNEVKRRMEKMISLAEKRDMILLHENEKEIYGDTPGRCLQLMEEFSSPHFRFAFDPANFVQCGVRPVSEAYGQLASYTDYVHIKDALFHNGEVVPPGEGDGEIKELLLELKKRGYAGYLSLEPHLAASSAYNGFTGPGLFHKASAALKNLLRGLDMKWN